MKMRIYLLTMVVFHGDVSHNQMVNHLTNTRSPGHPVAPQSKGQPKGQL